jgi:hypothetical protein
MGKKYVPDGVFLACDKGTCPSTYKVSFHNLTNVYNVPLASELDIIPFLNIKPMGFCMVKGMCTPMPLLWSGYKSDVMINGRLLLEDSTCQCMMGGKISIHFTRASANAVALWGGMKMPTEYIKDGFDWMAEQKGKFRNLRDQHLPDWMKPVAGVTDWMEDFSLGLVEGAVNGVVGLGETVYQVAQDPVGTAEALGGMAKKGWDWASEGDNWSNAASGAWNWASDGSNWTQAAQDGANWVAENPRGLSNAVGEFIPDAAAAVYSGGSSLALSGAKVAGKEVLEEGAERAVREAVEEGAERAGREVAEEAAEAGGQRVGREAVEEMMEHADDGGVPIVETGDNIVENTADDLAEQAAKKAEFETVTLADGTKVKRLKPNMEYEANGYKYKTDEFGRIKEGSGKLRLEKGGRNEYAQRSVGKKDGRLADDQGGHLFGDQFGGAGGKENLVPMDKGVNNYHKGEWGQMEKNWAEQLNNGKNVDVKIEPQYGDNSMRPSHFKITQTIDGVTKKITIFN